MLPNFNMLFQLVLTKFSKSELFSCLPKVVHVIKYCKRPIVYVNHLAEKNRPYLTIQKIYITINGLFQKKSTPPWWKACWKILTGGAVNSSGNSYGRGSWNVKIHPQGLLSILLMFQLLQLIKEKIALHFSILLFFQTTDLLPHLF